MAKGSKDRFQPKAPEPVAPEPSVKMAPAVAELLAEPIKLDPEPLRFAPVKQFAPEPPSVPTVSFTPSVPEKTRLEMEAGKATLSKLNR